MKTLVGADEPEPAKGGLITGPVVIIESGTTCAFPRPAWPTGVNITLNVEVPNPHLHTLIRDEIRRRGGPGAGAMLA